MSHDLLTLARENDLPPKWDGCLVEWQGWEAQAPMFICPPPTTRECCPGCGSAEPRVMNRGNVARTALVTPEMVLRREEERARLGAGLRHKRPPLLLLRLWAWRCQDCRHDQVHDIDTDQWFDLDHTDYGPEGSR